MAASPSAAAAAAGNLHCVLVAVDGSEESMNALRWALDNLRLSSRGEGEEPATLHVLHVQSPPSIAAGLNPGAIPFGGPSHVEVPAFAAAIEAHQRRISEAIITHAMQICAEKHVNAKSQVIVGDPKELICEVTASLQADLLVMGCRAFGPIKRIDGERKQAGRKGAQHKQKLERTLKHSEQAYTMEPGEWGMQDGLPSAAVAAT